MNAAVYTLIGVGVAATFAIAKDLLVEGRRDRAERARTRRDELREARIACLLIGDELDTLAANFDLLGELGRTPARPLGESPFLSTRQWHTHNAKLALVIDQLDTWKALASLYHNADSLRTRVINDGPNAPLDRLENLKQQAVDARELAEISYEATAVIARQLTHGEPSRLTRWRRTIAARAHLPR